MSSWRISIFAVALLAALVGAARYHAMVRSLSTDEASTRSATDVDLGPVGEFTLTERDGTPVSRDDLKGKVWVASFVFTCCTTQCPQISGTMAELHRELAGEPDARLVTFTVDPERDTPEKLKQYAGTFGAEGKRWLFLTGKRDELYGLIERSFHLTVKQNEGAARTPGNEVLHDFRLVVVDRRGHIRGYFDGRRVDGEGKPVNDVPRLKQKVVELLREAGPG
jgi:protein SCO1/2